MDRSQTPLVDEGDLASIVRSHRPWPSSSSSLNFIARGSSNNNSNSSNNNNNSFNSNSFSLPFSSPCPPPSSDSLLSPTLSSSFEICRSLLHPHPFLKTPSSLPPPPPPIDCLDSDIPSSSSYMSGLLDSIPPFPSSPPTWFPPKKFSRLTDAPELCSTAISARTAASNFLRGYLHVKHGIGFGAVSSDAAPQGSSTAPTSSLNILSRISAALPAPEYPVSNFKLSGNGSPVGKQELSGFSSKTLDEPSPRVKQQECLAAQNNNSCKGRGAKRRKAQQKRVVCVQASGGAGRPTGECLPSDLWAWRKYGQKPIKGSPHPRGYYRCSSSKGCPARKQVERSRTDPTMLVVTYTYDHNHAWPTHRNALAGSTRQSPLEKSSTQSPDCAAQSASSNCAPSADHDPFQTLMDSPELAQEHVSSPGMNVDEAFSPVHQDESLHALSSNLHEVLFAELDEFPEPFTSFGGQVMEDRSIEDGVSAVVDPYNLFNWSSSSFTRVNDVVR